MAAQSSAQEFLGPDLGLKWVTISERVQVARHTKRPSDENAFLLDTAKAEPNSPLSPLLRLWAADSLKLENRYREAIQHYDEVLPTPTDSTLASIDVSAESLASKAVLLSRLQQWDGALEVLSELELRDGRANWSRMQSARILQTAGRTDEAIAAYRRVQSISANATHEDGHLPELAGRNAQLLEDPRGVFRESPTELTRLLAAALETNDFPSLQELASHTHFSIGLAGGHPEFVDREEVLGYLRSDLARSSKRLTSHEVTGVGQKRYFLTRGWRGQWFSGRVSFYLVYTVKGWQWRGLVLRTPNRRWLKHWIPPKLEKNQPLGITVGCPWPSGVQFMAGGLRQFTRDMVLIAALALLWPVGTTLAAGTLIFFSLRPCGFGTRGFYYNHGPTHRGGSAFAIDFTRYRRGIPFLNDSGGTAVLAAGWGMVSRVDDSAESGDSDAANRVHINHVRGETATGTWDPTTGTTTTGPTMFVFEPYQSRYLHLSGPFAIPVSVGMSARKGARLGTMNDTGNSVVDHLHFSLHDTRTGMSVRPSPMDGRALLDRDDGSCIRSSTVTFP